MCQRRCGPIECRRRRHCHSSAERSGSIRTKSVSRPRMCIIVTDTFGRTWREGLVDVVIGIAGVPLFIDFRGQHDVYGLPLHATILAAADSLAAAAGLVMGKTAKTPAALIRGFPWEATQSSV